MLILRRWEPSMFGGFASARLAKNLVLAGFPVPGVGNGRIPGPTGGKPAGFPVPGSGFPVPGSGFPVSGPGFPVPGPGFPVLWCGFPVLVERKAKKPHPISQNLRAVSSGRRNRKTRTRSTAQRGSADSWNLADWLNNNSCYLTGGERFLRPLGAQRKPQDVPKAFCTSSRPDRAEGALYLQESRSDRAEGPLYVNQTRK